MTSVQVGELYTYGVEIAPAGEDIALDAVQPFTVTAPLLPAWLALGILDDGTIEITGTPGVGDAGEHAVELDVTDPVGLVLTQTYTITVDPGPITATLSALETPEDVPVEGFLDAQQREGQPLTFTVAAPAVNGEADFADPTSGAFAYIPNPDYAGDDAFTVVVVDTDGFSITVPVSITVLLVDDAPSITVPSTYVLEVGAEVNIPVEVRDVNHAVYTVTVDSLPAGLETA